MGQFKVTHTPGAYYLAVQLLQPLVDPHVAFTLTSDLTLLILLRVAHDFAGPQPDPDVSDSVDLSCIINTTHLAVTRSSGHIYLLVGVIYVRFLQVLAFTVPLLVEI